MVPISRRRLLVAGGITAAAGCLSTAPDERSNGTDDPTTDNETTTDEDSGLPDALVEALGVLPAEVDGERPSRVVVISPDPDEQYGESVADQFGLDPSSVDYGVSATYDEQSASIVAFSGSYDPADASVEDDLATGTVDGQLVAAMGYDDGEQWTGGIDAARSAAEGSTASLADSDRIATVVEPVVDEQLVRVITRFDGERSYRRWESLDADAVDAVAVASTELGERTSRQTFVALFSDESSVDAETLRTAVENNWGEGIQERSVETDGRRGVVTITYEQPPQPDRDASPDAHFDIEYDDGAAEATVTHRSGESVGAEELTVKVDGEPTDAQFADEYDTVEAGDAITVAADPFSHVRVRWEDPEDEETFDHLADRIAYDRSSFETAYAVDAERVTITYTGDQPADTDRLEVDHRRDVRDDDAYERPEETPVSEYHETLTAGDEIVVEGVTPGDRVSISCTVEVGNGAYGTSVVSVAARPSGYFAVERENGETSLVYAGDAGHAAIDASVDEYRVLVDGEPAATQFADRYDELSEGDAIDLDADLGAEVTVEWVGADERMEVTSQVVTPDVSFAFDTLDDGRVEITHDGGEPVDAGDLTVTFHGDGPSEDTVAWGESGETVEEGDSITVEVPDDARYVIVQHGDRGLDGERLED
ncbi:hypothetical protein G9464_07960 [Halostella sp. JP-L12]|uniref:type IV pilin N-terminal domain-containing protein n=1 Tax=Halostella TaxID=1843185 RepID=UPI000EF76A4B|nr:MULTISPECIES: type IV pilin N-terminal domain-containing protein [Halostella]NHN47529.1 hypothetical protein [Halostella sp. JP-L12]